MAQMNKTEIKELVKDGIYHNDLLDVYALKMYKLMAESKQGMTINELAKQMSSSKRIISRKFLVKRLHFLMWLDIVRRINKPAKTSQGRFVYQASFSVVPLSDLKNRVVKQLLSSDSALDEVA